MVWNLSTAGRELKWAADGVRAVSVGNSDVFESAAFALEVY